MAEEFLLLILSSPSGAGKTTLTRKLLARFPELRFSVSHTTRPPRSVEQDGRDYHFVAREVFERMIASQQFVEWAEVHGNLYGTARAEIERAQLDPACTGMLFDIDYQGARQIRATVPEVIGIFVLPPSMEELERRLRGRQSETEDAILRRFAAAKKEIEHYALFEYLIVNDDVNLAYAHLEGIILAERSRRTRKAVVAETLLRKGSL
jgi:guanylate kinase